MNTHHRIIIGDCMEGMAGLPDGSVHCCITSPPYWGLRDYGTAEWDGGDPECDHDQRRRERDPESKSASNAGASRDGVAGSDHCRKCGARRIDQQLGLEATPDEYVAKMVAVFREVRRVLRDDGTLWLNLGDSYSSGGRDSYGTFSPDSKQASHAAIKSSPRPGNPPGLKPKDLCGIPWRVAFALQADGWYLRQDIIWAKPNPMPESVTDRCTKAHEYVFLLTKSARYYYDAEAIKEPHATPLHAPGNLPRNTGGGQDFGDGRESAIWGSPNGRNRRSVWTVPTAPYSEAHFATYPPKLIEPMILSGTSAKGCCAACGAPWERVVERGELVADADGYKPRGNKRGDAFVKNAMAPAGATKGHPNFHYERTTTGWQPTCTCNAAIIPATVFDPFGGSGTTAAVALQHGRNAILCELNPEYAAMAERRIGMATRPDTYRDESKADDAPLFMGVSA